MIEQSLQKISRWASKAGYGTFTKRDAIGGGCINTAYRLASSEGLSVFVKLHESPPTDFFKSEAIGLEALRNAKVIKVPDVLLIDDAFLVLEDLVPALPAKHYWPMFGHQLAELHNVKQQQFGFTSDNYCGTTPQSNTKTDDGHQFFANYRLQAQAELASHRDLLDVVTRNKIDVICSNLSALVPVQAPSLLHGDLWSGNAHISPEGEPVLIDPACYWGWAEAELAMTQLFGGFPDIFYQAYAEVYPLESGWKERLPLYNLYHLLNHLNLFGKSYLGQVRSVVDRYA